MNYRTLIKQKFPFVATTLRRHPKMMGAALQVESALINRKRKKNTKKLSGSVSSSQFDELQYLDTCKQHGLFDYKWYCDIQHRHFESEEHAFSDYLRKSKFSAVSPSPAFDNLNYHKHNIDVYHAGMSPLIHYITDGHKEGRIVTPFAPKWTPTSTLTITPNQKTISAAKIAVCLHVFYADFIDYYAECLKSFPTVVDLFISVSDMAYKDLIETQLAPLPSVGKIKIAEVPNRGRNFGPMLVEFGRDLLEYDLFCHLHSKKSLYSGRLQTQWADYLGEYLLKDQCVIAKMITQMMNDAECGVYYPTSFSMMPDWVNHWLKNKPFKQRFFDQWGINDHSEFIAYPVGGMFWAKPAALQQMLEQSYTYDDFPAEPLPNDGSELHALERCIGLLAERNGYKQLFFYPELGCFTLDKSHIFSSYVNNKEQIYYKLLPFETISFDVFDTLIRRSHHVPDYAKLKLGKHLTELALVDSADEFVRQRNQAEFMVRQDKQFQGDVTIFETYAKLAQLNGWDGEQAKRFADMEFAYDLDMIESKDEMVEIANSLIIQGKQVLVISDTYYTEHQVVLMLRKAGVTNGYKLYVSSERGLRKDNGTMWSYLVEKLKNKHTFVHVGDNAVADAQIPGDFGLANLHILNPLDKWQAAGWHNPLSGHRELNEKEILKWGPLISQFGRFPFLGE